MKRITLVVLGVGAVVVLYLVLGGLLLFRPYAADALAGADGVQPRIAKLVIAPPKQAAERGHGGGTGGLGVAGRGNLGGELPAMKGLLVGAVPPPKEAEATTRRETEPAPTRSWFPESFLFEPLVVTDQNGRAIVPVRVPDRLTHWRVLALAHSRGGAQAGAVTRFAGTLPTYVDAVVPPFLVAGDEVRLPIHLVNTTAKEIATALRLEARGATLSAAGGSLRVPAEGTRVEYATLKADRPGKVALKATLGETDAVERTIEVLPSGRPVSVSRGGTLASPRELELEGAVDSLPDSERARLLVFPGALALLRSELSAAPHRASTSNDAYSLLLAGKAPSLLGALGAAPDRDAVRELSLIATQRAMQHSRAPDPHTAALFAEAALAHGDNPVLSRLGERLAATVASSQRPDGTCQGGEGWTLQRVLVATAECARAVNAAQSTPSSRQRAIGFNLRAAGAFERNLGRIEEGYTAAAILAGGALSGSLADQLREKVQAALKSREDGAKFLPVDQGVVRSDGKPPSEAEATALAVLALEADARAQLADLGTSLLSGYHPSFGWGDGETNLVCMRAAIRLFKDPIPPNVAITLEMDGKAVAQGALEPSRLKDVLTLEAAAPGSAGKHSWRVRAEPSVPGLGFSLTLASFVPWKQEEANGGLDLAITAPRELSVGRPVDVALSASAPSGMALKVRHALPAGLQPDSASLAALVASGALSRFETEDGAITLEVPPRPAGQPFSASYRVVPTLAGTLQAPASTVASLERPEQVRYVAPAVWMVR